MHFDRRHPYERFLSRLSATQASSERQAASGFAAFRDRNRSLFTVHRSRLILYSCLVVLVLATLIWSGQRTHGIAVASADSLAHASNAYTTARSKALADSKLTPVELLKKAVPMIDGPKRATAIELLTEANRRDPQLRDAAIHLGYAYMKNGDWRAAKTALDKAKAVDGSWPETYKLLAVVDHQLGDKNAAQEALARAKQFELVAKLPELTK